MKTILLLLIGGMGLASVTHAQDLLADMERMRLALKAPKSFLLDIQATIEYTDAMNDGDLPKNIHTVIKIGDGLYYYENEMTTMVINRQWVVGAIHGQKQIIYGRNNSRELEMARKKALEKDIPTDPKLAAKASFLGEADGVKHYRISQPGNGLKSMDMYINSATGYFTKLVNEYADPAKTGVLRTVTVFNRFTDNASFGPEEFSEKLLLRFSGKTAQPVEKYKNYHILYTDPELLNNF